MKGKTEIRKDNTLEKFNLLLMEIPLICQIDPHYTDISSLYFYTYGLEREK